MSSCDRRHERKPKLVETLERRTLLSAGDPNVAFGQGGTVDVATDLFRVFEQEIRQFADKTILRANISTGNPQSTLFVRLNDDGSLDTTFDGDGKAVLNGEIDAFDIGSDGSIFGVGNDTAPVIENGEPRSKTVTTVYKLTPGGALDLQFGGGDGLATFDDLGGRSLEQAEIKTVDNNGGILLRKGSEIVRLRQDGTLDSGYANGTGQFSLPIPSIRNVSLLGDGSTLAVGHSIGNLDDNAIYKVAASGELDTAFGGGDGITELPPTIGNETDPASQTDGKILLSSIVNGTVHMVRLYANGAVDTDFGDAGLVEIAELDIGGFGVGDVQLDRKDRIVFAVATSEGVTPIRLRSNGMLNKVFEPIFLGSTRSIDQLLIAPDDKIMVLGTVYSSELNILSLMTVEGFAVRYKLDGKLDRSYSEGLGARPADEINVAKPDGRVLSVASVVASFDSPTVLRFSEYSYEDDKLDPTDIQYKRGKKLLIVNGTDGPDRIDVKQVGNDGDARIMVRYGDYHRFFPTNLNRIDVYGNGGDDVIYAGAPKFQRLFGGEGNDTIQGTFDYPTTLFFTGTRGALIDGGPGDDVLVGTNAGDDIYGGDGDDFLGGDSRVSDEDGGSRPAGDDRLFGGPGNDRLIGYAGNDHLDGGDGNDYLSGGQGSDRLDGGFGDDQLDAGRLYGEDTGNDVLYYGDRTGDVKVDLMTVDFVYFDRLRGSAGEAGENDQIIDTFEVVITGSGNDEIRGDEFANIFFSNAGNDFLDGRGGDDQLTGGPGLDRLYGSAGNDILYGDDGEADYLDGGPDLDSADKDDNDAVFAIESFI